MSIWRESGLQLTCVRPAEPSSILHFHSGFSNEKTCIKFLLFKLQSKISESFDHFFFVIVENKNKNFFLFYLSFTWIKLIVSKQVNMLTISKLVVSLITSLNCETVAKNFPFGEYSHIWFVCLNKSEKFIFFAQQKIVINNEIQNPSTTYL